MVPSGKKTGVGNQDAYVKTLKTTSLESYHQGFILADLNKSGILHLHQSMAWRGQ
jgi:hypothetical protein